MRKKNKKQKVDQNVEEPMTEQTTADQAEKAEHAESTKNQAEQQSTSDDKSVTLMKEISDLKDKNLRMRAEFENYRRRTLKEKLEDRKLAKKDIMTELLPILDDFDRANKVAVENVTLESISEGMRLVHQKFIKTLTSQGLEAVDSTNEMFDPELHEAIAEIPAPTKKLKGKVIDTIERGYKLNGIIIRHPKVVVGK